MKTDKLTQEAVDTLKEERTPEQQALVEKHCDEHERLMSEIKCPVRVEEGELTMDGFTIYQFDLYDANDKWLFAMVFDEEHKDLTPFTLEETKSNAHSIADAINGRAKMVEFKEKRKRFMDAIEKLTKEDWDWLKESQARKE